MRSIIETVLLDIMYELPSRTDVSKCVITKDTIIKKTSPVLYDKSNKLINIEIKSEESA